MHIRTLTATLKTADIQGTIRFYTEVLDFILAETRNENGLIVGCTLQKDKSRIMFVQSDEALNASVSILLEPDNLDECWKQLKDKTTADYSLQNFEYGTKAFAIRDNNGYVLSFSRKLNPETPYDRFFSPSFMLETPRVVLRLMEDSDTEVFHSIRTSSSTWKYFTKQLSDKHSLDEWMEEAFSEKLQQKRVPFTIIDKDTDKVCGSTSYGNISFYDKRLEIGWSWLGDEFIGTGINKHAKFALLSFAFEVMNMERVEIKTDVLNDRARAALLKVGMIPEGVLRSHTQMHSDRRRDTIYYGLLRSEWAERKSQFFGEML